MQQTQCGRPRAGIRREHGFQTRLPATANPTVHHLSNDPGYTAKVQAPFKECLDGNLVGGIQDHGRVATRAGGVET